MTLFCRFGAMLYAQTETHALDGITHVCRDVAADLSSFIYILMFKINVKIVLEEIIPIRLLLTTSTVEAPLTYSVMDKILRNLRETLGLQYCQESVPQSLYAALHKFSIKKKSANSQTFLHIWHSMDQDQHCKCDCSKLSWFFSKFGSTACFFYQKIIIKTDSSCVVWFLRYDQLCTFFEMLTQSNSCLDSTAARLTHEILIMVTK